MKDNECSEEHYNKVMKDPKTCPKDCPKMKKGLINSEFVELKEIKNQLKDLQEQIAKKEKTAYGDDNDEDRKEAFTGVVFIVLD